MTAYQSREMEGAARALCTLHTHVVALHWLQNVRKLPLRDTELSDVQLYRAINKAKADPDIRAWRKTGGLYVRQYSGQPDYGHTQGLLFVECPADMEEFERDSAPCTDDVVIYRPPAWLDHENTLVDMFPTAAIAKRFWETMEIFRTRDRKPLHAAMLKIMELPASDVVCVSKAEFYKTANISARQMFRISMNDSGILDKQRGKHYCTAVGMRFEPERKDQLALYNWILENCQRYMQWHIIRSNEPGKLFPHWKNTLRNMAYGSFVQREDEVNFYMLTGAKPDFTSYDLELRRARDRLKAMIRFVEGLPEFPPAATPRARRAAVRSK